MGKRFIFRLLLVEMGAIDDNNREAVVQWLEDRGQFHTWFTSIITGGIVLLTTLGPKPTAGASQGTVALVSFGLLYLAVLANLVCVLTIPSWKYGVRTGRITDAAPMRFDLGVTNWIGVSSLLAGLVLSTAATFLG